MPRKRVRTTEINAYSAEKLEEALNAIRNGRKIREVGRAYDIPESALRKKLLLNEPKTLRLRQKTTFTRAVEDELKHYVLTLSK